MRRWIAALTVLMLAAPALASETITYTYDAAGRLTQVQHSGSANNGLTVQYQLDKADNVANKTVSVPAASPPDLTATVGPSPLTTTAGVATTLGGTVVNNGGPAGSFTSQFQFRDGAGNCTAPWCIDVSSNAITLAGGASGSVSGAYTFNTVGNYAR